MSNEYPIVTKSGSVIRNDQERYTYMLEQSKIATVCLFMVSIHAIMANGARITAAAYPWECLTTAASFHAAGAVSVSMHAGRGGDYWHYFKPGKVAIKVRNRAYAGAV